ncbi:MAG: hypothetical protein BroJett030_29040 [Alphaproteobacteria bacterium]|nr:MAG: hypothetical protein BroJett030_29040 [Alphaproteobacteria bacterium]
MIVWRTKSNNYDVASARYRTVYPAWFIDRHLGIDSRFVSGRTSARMLNQLGNDTRNAIVFAKHFSRADRVLATRAKARGARIVWDQCDNLFAKQTRSKRDNPEIVAAAIELFDALVFPTATLRAVFVDHGFPADRCHVVADAMIAGEDELAALAWADERVRFFPRLPLWPARRGWRRPVPASLDTALPPKRGERLVWFGAAGSKFGRTGVGLLADLVPALNALHADRPLDLLLVTNDAEACAAAMAGAALPWHFLRWSVAGAIAAVRSADACLLPAGGDAFSATKSANRVLMAAANGIPAVTSRHPSIAGFEAGFFIPEGDDWLPAIAAALNARRDGAGAAARSKLLAPAFGAEAIAQAWAAILGLDRDLGRAA